ncbi:hypothetical protein AK812_SmicGene37090 [Symbiodinium microadriaticum]|uniref:Uncharacterized protein n=1 Tax=Symbiodinium microadriaticum TaxID=2951 RepID=A0A1Q9CHE2_SYMMI|nr:hypothetical protein AK812_SmicGene37090 [Symbiodinium microadriaticum]
MHTIVAAAMPKLAALNSQHSAHMFWSFGSSAVIARSFLEAPAEHAIKSAFDSNCQELANSVRECAKLAFVNEQLLGATMQAGGLRIPDSVPQDFANVSRELCKTSHIDVPTTSATASLSLQRVHESNAQDLANAVQRLANAQFRSVLLMHSAAHHAGTQWMGQFEGSDFSSTAWSFSTMESTCEALFEAIAEEVREQWRKSFGQCSQVIIQQFAQDVPSSMDGFRSGRYQSLVEDLAVDSFGSWGDRLLLDLLGIPECTWAGLPGKGPVPSFGVCWKQTAVRPPNSQKSIRSNSKAGGAALLVYFSAEIARTRKVCYARKCGARESSAQRANALDGQSLEEPLSA